MNRLLNVLQLLRSRTHKTQVELAANLVVELPGNADASRLGEGFQPCCDVHPVTIEVVALHDHVPKIQPYPELHLVLSGHLVVAVPHVLLEFHRRHDSVHRTGELCDHRVSGTPEDASVVGLDGLVGDSTADFEVAQRAILILAHHLTESDYVCSEDSG